jgi:hypothetical protein
MCQHSTPTGGPAHPAGTKAVLMHDTCLDGMHQELHQLQHALAKAEAERDAGYSDRIVLAAYIASTRPRDSYVKPNADPVSPGFTDILLLTLPCPEGDRQVTLHIADADAYLVSDVPRCNTVRWDGHDKDEAIRRIRTATAANWIRADVPPHQCREAGEEVMQ